MGGREAQNAPARNAPVGTVLGGRYKILGVLGAGGMAVVYRAEDAVLGRTVALKMLHRRYAEEPPFRLRFKQEARAMASLDHENIIKVFDISRDGQVPFIVAECFGGGDDLGALLDRNGRLSEGFTLEVAAQLLRALSYAHRRGIIHRDIKPSNIIMTRDRIVKVADFGIARIVENDEAGRPGEIIGSARYMSPEQLTGKEATPRSDVYSVGVLLYHCLTGEPPFVGDVKSLARQQLREPPRPPRELNGRISRHTEAVILKALAKAPEDRYPSASAMLEDLRGGGAKRGLRRGGGRLLLAAALVLLLLLGGAWFAAGPRSADPAPDRGAHTEPADEPGDAAEPAEVDPPEAPKPRKAASPDAAGDEDDKRKAAAGYVPVPDVRKYFDYSAEEILINDGFKARIVYDYHPGYAPRGVAWGTRPATGTMMPPGSTITVYATPKDLFQPRL